MKEGMRLANKYEILKEIGKGGMSIVYLAMDLHIHKMWAIKVMKRAHSSSSILMQAWTKEADLLKNLIIPVYRALLILLKQVRSLHRHGLY